MHQLALHTVKNMKGIIISLLCIVMNYGMQANQGFPKSSIIRSDSKTFTIRLNVEIIGYDTILTADGKTTLFPKIKNAIIKGQPGSPSEIVYTIPLTVPDAKNFTLQSCKTGMIRQVNGLIAPVPTPIRDAQDISIFTHSIDEEAYAKEQMWQWAEISYSGIARNRHIAHLNIKALRANTVTGILEIPKTIECTVIFTPSNIGSVQTRDDINDFDITANHAQTKAWRLQNHVSFAKITPKTAQLNGPTAMVTINQQGIQKLDRSALASAGINVSKELIPTIKVFGLGGTMLSEHVDSASANTMTEQPIIVKTRSDGELDAIYFYGELANGFRLNTDENGKNLDFRHFTHPYTKESSYLITVGGDNGLRATPIPAISADSIQFRPSTFMSRTFNEEELMNAFAAPSGRIWFGKTIESISPRTYTTVLTDFARIDSVVYRYKVVSKNRASGNLVVAEQNNQIDNLTIPAANPTNYLEACSTPLREVSVSSSAIAQDNRSVLRFSYQSPQGGIASTAIVDWFEILYPRTLTASDNQLEIYSDVKRTGATEYNVSRFSAQELYGFDITNPRYPQLLENVSTTGGIYVFRVNEEAQNPRRYFISGTIVTPSIKAITVANLRMDNAGADMLVITHPDLMQSALKYKEYRESTGISVKIVTTEDIYAEFACGMPDITAIRDYAAHALKAWTNKPKYLMFWGDGHYDFKNIQVSNTNYIPTYQLDGNSNEYFWETKSACIDDYFARLIGDDYLIDIMMARMPVLSNESGIFLVEKIRRYEQELVKGTWQQTICLVADDGPTGGTSSDSALHTSQSEGLVRDAIPDDMLLKKIYLAQYPAEIVANGRRKPMVTQDLLSEINDNGAVLLNWIGHGSPRLWAHERIFEKETTIPQMLNKDKLFFLTAATCDFARFDDAERESGAEDLLRSERGGAIGVFAATRLVYSGENAVICDRFYKNIFSRDANGNYVSIGEAMYKTKQELFGDNDEKYLIVGDPALHLQLPNDIVTFDSINATYVDEDPTIPDSLRITIKALQKVEVKGSIRNASTNGVDESFDGTILVTVKDSDISLSVKDPIDNTTHIINEQGNVLARSTFKVENGQFEGSFIVPKDIGFTNKPGRMLGFAYSNDDVTAKGSTRAFKVGGIESISEPDTIGPEIAVYLDNRTFQPGNLVRRNPLLIVDLYDNTAINTTGAGIGHNIEAWFNSDRIPTDLTNDYQADLSDARKGTAQKRIFNLKSGTNSVRVRAWDIWNNYSEVETYFRLADNDSTLITEGLFVYPNPTTQFANIGFIHNQSLPTEAEIRIFDFVGRLVKKETIEKQELHTWTYRWDCTDMQKTPVPMGVYVCVMHVKQENGPSTTLHGKIIVTQ